MAWTEEAGVATAGSAEAGSARAGEREPPTMDYVMKLNHGNVIAFRDIYLFEYWIPPSNPRVIQATHRLGGLHGNGRKWRLGEKVCDWREEAMAATSGSKEAVTP